jgi:hypothetical protein
MASVVTGPTKRFRECKKFVQNKNKYPGLPHRFNNIKVRMNVSDFLSRGNASRVLIVSSLF